MYIDLEAIRDRSVATGGRLPTNIVKCPQLEANYDAVKTYVHVYMTGVSVGVYQGPQRSNYLGVGRSLHLPVTPQGGWRDHRTQCHTHSLIIDFLYSGEIYLSTRPSHEPFKDPYLKNTTFNKEITHSTYANGNVEFCLMICRHDSCDLDIMVVFERWRSGEVSDKWTPSNTVT